MGFLAVFVCILATLATALYFFVKNLQTYWKRRGIPYDEPSFPLGNISLTRHMREITREHYQKYKSVGPFGGFHFFLKPAVLICDLDLVKNIFIRDFSNFTNRGLFHNEKDDPLTTNLLNLDGAKWKDMRTKLSPTFNSGRMKYMFPTVISVAERLVETVDESTKNDCNLEVKDILGRFTVDVIGTCAFGIECNSLKDPTAEFRRMGVNALKLSRHNILVKLFILSFPNLAERLRMKQTPDVVEQFFLRVVRETVEYREKNNIKRNDFMNLLLELRNSEEGLSIEQLTAQTFIFFLAGSETSSTTLGHALYELAMNQEVQDKLRADVNDQLDKHDGELSYDCLMEMQYVEKVFKETLRKYPVITNLVRKSVKDYQTSNSKYVIPGNTTCLIPVDAIHHDPEIYPDPEKFDPERFSPEEVQKRHPCSWLPFGEGPRHCIGLRFGRMQSSIALALLVKNYKFSVCEKTPTALEMDPSSITLASVGGIYLHVERI